MVLVFYGSAFAGMAATAYCIVVYLKFCKTTLDPMGSPR